MEEKKLLDFLKQARKVLSDFFPSGSAALLPAIFAALVWAVKDRGEVKKKIMEIKVWLEPEALRNKPAEFILNFFESRPQLYASYEGEIKHRNWKVLRPAFRALYPVLELEDPFLERLFSAELENNDYRLLVDDFRTRLKKVLSEIKAAGTRQDFWKTMEKICAGFLSLGWTLLTEDEVRKQLKQAMDRL